MKEIESLISSLQLTQNMNKSLGFSSQITDMIRTHEIMANKLSGLGSISQFIDGFQQRNAVNNLTGINMVSELAKSIQKQEHITKQMTNIGMMGGLFENMQKQQKNLNPAYQAMEAITKSLQPLIPQVTLDTISSINNQHNLLFGNLRNLSEVLTKNQSILSQINNWQFTISGISGQLAAVAATHKKWDLIEDFEEITEEAISLNDRIFSEDGLTQDGFNELKVFFERIEIKVSKIDSDANVLFWKLLTILSFILSMMGEARNWLPNPEHVTKQDVESLIKQQFIIYEKKLKEEKEYRITKRESIVTSKPKLKSIVIDKLPVDFEVIVLQINHKWVYVSYNSLIDNLPQTGWILKKYLDKPTK